MKIRALENPRQREPDHFFQCPGCGFEHGIWTRNPQFNPVWAFDGNMEKPTISPSILVTIGHGDKPSDICHSFVRNGMIQFLDDCTHALKGQTVELPEYS